MMVYEAMIHFVHKTEEGMRESVHTILYPADNDTMAVLDAVRWAEDRHRNIPDYFSKLGAFTIWHRGFSKIEIDGYQHQEPRKLLVAWKEGHIRSAAEHLFDMDISPNMPVAPDPLGLPTKT